MKLIPLDQSIKVKVLYHSIYIILPYVLLDLIKKSVKTLNAGDLLYIFEEYVADLERPLILT